MTAPAPLLFTSTIPAHVGLCQEVTITWSGGDAPFDLLIKDPVHVFHGDAPIRTHSRSPASSPGTQNTFLGQTDDHSFVWTVNTDSSSEHVVINLMDSHGNTIHSGSLVADQGITLCGQSGGQGLSVTAGLPSSTPPPLPPLTSSAPPKTPSSSSSLPSSQSATTTQGVSQSESTATATKSGSASAVSGSILPTNSGGARLPNSVSDGSTSLVIATGAAPLPSGAHPTGGERNLTGGKKRNIGGIVGAVVGGVLIVLLGVFFIHQFCRRRKQRRRSITEADGYRYDPDAESMSEVGNGWGGGREGDGLGDKVGALRPFQSNRRHTATSSKAKHTPEATASSPNDIFPGSSKAFNESFYRSSPSAPSAPCAPSSPVSPEVAPIRRDVSPLNIEHRTGTGIDRREIETTTLRSPVGSPVAIVSSGTDADGEENVQVLLHEDSGLRIPHRNVNVHMVELPPSYVAL